MQLEVHQLRHQLDETKDKDQQIEERDENVHRITLELETNQQVIAQFQSRIQDLEQQLSGKLPAEVLAKASVKDPPQFNHTNGDDIKLTWREATAAPCTMIRLTDPIVDGDMVYLRVSGTQNLYAYCSESKEWSRLPDCPAKLCSLTVVKGHLTTVGGEIKSEVTNQLFSLTGEVNHGRWRRVFQSMPTKRTRSIVVCTNKAMIVAGGRDQDNKTLTTVEIADIATEQWSSAAELSGPLSSASVTLCDDRIYILGGWCDGVSVASVYTCLLINLFQSCKTQSVGELLAKCSLETAKAQSTTTVWNKIADLPVTKSTCVAIHGHLLAIGGGNLMFASPTADIRVYRPSSNKWEVVSKMNYRRRQCFAVVLSDNKLMVAGGYTSLIGNSDTASVEIATVA